MSDLKNPLYWVLFDLGLVLIFLYMGFHSVTESLSTIRDLLEEIRDDIRAGREV